MTTNDQTKKCPYCAEDIRMEAVRCRYCRSRLAGGFDGRAWHRDHEQARLAGVAAAIAHGFDVPLSMVRLGFLVFTVFHFLGPILYVGLWLVIPQSEKHESLFETFASSIFHAAREMSARRSRASDGPYDGMDGRSNSGRSSWSPSDWEGDDTPSQRRRRRPSAEDGEPHERS